MKKRTELSARFLPVILFISVSVAILVLETEAAEHLYLYELFGVFLSLVVAVNGIYSMSDIT